MTDLSREELRAHLSAVEAQLRAALRIVAAESKSVQQAHSALRADLSAALIRLQAEMNGGSGKLDNKLDRVLSDVSNLGRQRKMTTAILTTLVLLFGITVGVLAGGSWYFLQQNNNSASANLPFIEAPALSDTRTPSAAPQAPAPQAAPAQEVAAPTPAPARSVSAAPAPAAPTAPVTPAAPTNEPSVRILSAQ